MNIKVEQIGCNVLGGGAILTGIIKQALQQKGFAIVENNADIIINSYVTVTPVGMQLVNKGILLAGLGTLAYLLGRK